MFIYASAICFSMPKTEDKIMQVFATDPSREFSTTQLVNRIFDVSSIEKDFQSDDKEIVKLAKRNKARFHRKLLYHLNKLVVDEIISISRIEGKGEKFFTLSTTKRDGKVQYLVDSASTESLDVVTGLEGYEEQLVVRRYDEKNWLSRINALLIEVPETIDVLNSLYSQFNDVVGIRNFEKFVDRTDLQSLKTLMLKLDADSKDFNKQINLLVDVYGIKDVVKFSDFVDLYVSLHPVNVHFLFLVDPKHVSNHTRLFKHVIKCFSHEKIRINIQNIAVKKAPLLIGRAGVYSLQDEEFEVYERTIKTGTIGLVYAGNALFVDVKKFFEKNSYSDFRELIIKCAKALLQATSIQRKKADIIFEKLNRLNHPNESAFFSFSRNYIRLWNYDLEKTDFSDYLNLLLSCKEQLAEFSLVEETIFKSCGIPIRFRVGLSSGFHSYARDFLSKRTYQKMTILGKKDFNKEEFVQYFNQRNSLLEAYDDADRIRIFRGGDVSPDDVLNEFVVLLTTYSAPLFSYDFKPRKGELTLDNFFR